MYVPMRLLFYLVCWFFFAVASPYQYRQVYQLGHTPDDSHPYWFDCLHLGQQQIKHSIIDISFVGIQDDLEPPVFTL